MRINSISTPMVNRQQNKFTSPNFRGQQFPSGYYEDDEIELAKRFINQTGDEWRKMYKNEKGDKYGDLYMESHGLNWLLAPLGKLCNLDSENYIDNKEGAEFMRILLDACTLGLWELANSPISATEAYIRKARQNGKIDAKTARVATLICDMKRAKEEEFQETQINKLKKIMNKQERELEQYKNLEKLQKGFINCIEDERQGIDTVIPNAIMIEGSDKEQGEQFVDFARKQSGVYFATVNEDKTAKMQKDFYDALKNAKEKFDETGNRTLIEVKGMDKLVSKDTDFDITEWMKAILTACADDYKATVIFQTPDSSNFVAEINEPHRVGVNLKTN